MHRLKGAVVRRFPDHRRADARRYAAHFRAVVGHYDGRLPAHGLPAVGDLSWIEVVELPRLARELEAALRRRRQRDARRLRRTMAVLRNQRVQLEHHIAELANSRPAQPGALDDLLKALPPPPQNRGGAR